MSLAPSMRNNGNALSIMRGLIAYGSAEMVVRVVRLLVVIVIAKQLVPELVGVAALTLSLFELIRVLANIGVGQKIISTPESDLAAVCNSAYRIFWFWCSMVAILQLIVAATLLSFFDQPLAAQMLVLLCGVYFFMPGGLVQCFRLMRAKKLVSVAKIAAVQTISDHLLTCALVLLWANPWAIVLPKLLTAPLWLIMMRRSESWTYSPALGFASYTKMFSFGAAILGADILLALRSNLDKLIVSGLLGISALGTYYFAFNAGIGIIGALATAFGTVIYPHFCSPKSSAEQKATLTLAVVGGVAIFGGLSIAQYMLAPIYVPFLFGDQWLEAIPVIQILSLAGIPLLLAAITSAYLRAIDRSALDFWLGLAVCLTALTAMYFGTHKGLVEAAYGWVIGTSIVIGTYFTIFTFKTKLINRSR